MDDNDSSQLSLRDAADRLGVHYMTAYKYVRSGRLAAKKHGDEWFVRRGDVDRLTPGRQAMSTGARGRPRRRDTIVPQLEQRMMAGDERAAWQLLESALHAGASPEDVYLELLAPALGSIGQRWATGDIDVVDEHRASAVAQRLIGRMGPQFVRPGRTRGCVIIGVAAHDDHGLPSAILADLLRGQNFAVVDLGPNTPAASFAHAVAGAEKLVAVGIGATVPAALPAAKAAAGAVRATGWEGAIFVGGQAVPDRETAESLGATVWEPGTKRLIAALREIRPRTTPR